MINLKPEVVAQLERVLGSVEMLLPKAIKPVDWANCHAANWRRHSFSGYLEPVKVTDTTRLDELLGVEEQKKIMVSNTRQFLRGLPANNALLWGSRGTGKSSLVKALLNEFADEGLRIIQVEKEDLIYISEIFAAIEDQPYRYIMLCDDLTFETGELSYKMLKSALDGSVYSAPENVLIYVTSNRRYLLPEYDGDHLGGKYVKGELQQSEIQEEKSSLSDRFGLWVPFHVFSQDRYLEAVKFCLERWSRQLGREVAWSKDCELAAIKWSHDKSKRCGRTAYQFSKNWVGKNLMAQES
ncbi:ATP-binding protein [Geoalkalibacter halelectricus]|uniref:ATP-binding protein n=1 Tax=Geoalkalibacter halelectricus TaxID=2847045 RepID=A0ABY5ZJN5_9BACT|nr:ATP-binding protein [Geoalkalibacter halelectricus]MDO3377221.1 ATP-binding protein [Geoalkalibacter halelectricus]UWZ79352.1 ATP-binding protein [Geoalkalibacter halelectricus]